ncbi:hypothetical protein ACPDZN_005087 [Escherichia coli]|nr:hypothetical protein [Escherichia coli]EFI1613566.1 hypothetical protein [Escherichia coli]EFJ2864274.1 hypothetical protein [Escherichia coli]EIG5027183.1 hypothetical protein [Escherichia coli]EIG5484138.1 hypothetical protein [Escherichia coli]
MKNIAAQMVNFDREQMRRIANNMPEQYDEKPQVQQVAQIINGVFSQLLATFPASLANRDQNMRANALTDAELRRKAADELTCMTARINRGETIPEPVKQLPVMGGRPLNRVQALAKIAEIKAKFGLKGASV